MAGTADYQEEVLSNLLNLQAELRGEPREERSDDDGAADALAARDDEVRPESEPDPASAVRPATEAVTVATSGLQVTVAPSAAAVTERVAALNARLSRLEDTLAGVSSQIDGAQPEEPVASEPAVDPDAPWRSFLDLQRIVADRLDRR